jgi:hypothetical protein
MTAWGNALPRPWHQRVQVLRLLSTLEPTPWVGTIDGDSYPPIGRTRRHTVNISDADGTPRGTAWFKEGSFHSGLAGGLVIKPNQGEPPWQALERFIALLEVYRADMDQHRRLRS